MRKALILFAISKFLLLTPSLSAQTFWLEQNRGIAITVEFLKPYFVDSNSSSTTSALFLTGRLSLSETLTIVGDLPFAHHEFRDDFGLEGFNSSTILGNPYLGVEIANQAATFFTELGLYLPLSTDRGELSRATGIGIISDFDRFEAFELYDLAATARLNYRRELSSDFQLQLQGGLSGGINVEQDGGVPNFSTLDYGFQLRYQVEQVSFIGGLTGRYLLTGAAPFLFRFGPERHRTTYQFAVAASMDLGAVRPGVHFRLPVDNPLNDKIHFVLGLDLGIRLK